MVSGANRYLYIVVVFALPVMGIVTHMGIMGILYHVIWVMLEAVVTFLWGYKAELNNVQNLVYYIEDYN